MATFRLDLARKEQCSSICTKITPVPLDDKTGHSGAGVREIRGVEDEDKNGKRMRIGEGYDSLVNEEDVSQDDAWRKLQDGGVCTEGWFNK